MAGAEVIVEIQFPPDMSEVANATVRLYVEDVSWADAPAHLITEQVRHGIDLAPGQRLSVVITVPSERLNANATYNVRVWIGSGSETGIMPGNFVSTQSHPVLTHGAPARVVIPVRQIR